MHPMKNTKSAKDRNLKRELRKKARGGAPARTKGRGEEINTTSLRVIMQEKKMSIGHVAMLVDVSAQTVSDWLGGRRRPRKAMFERLCTALEISPEQVLMTSQELVERSRHTRVVRFYQREMMGENDNPTYDEVRLIESDLQDAAERDAAEAEVKAGDITVSGSLESPADSESDAEGSDDV